LTVSNRRILRRRTNDKQDPDYSGLCPICLNHFVICLYVFQLRLQDKGFRLQLLGRCRNLLRSKRAAFFQLPHRNTCDSVRTARSSSETFINLARTFQLVVCRLYAQFDFFCDVGEIFFRLGQLRSLLPDGGISLAAVEKVVANLHAKGSEVVH